MKDTLEKMTSKISISLVLSVLLIGSLGTATAGTIYVDANAALGGDGTTWGTAYKYLQDALYKPPVSGDDIWVAAGTYKPDQDEGSNVTTGDRNATFELKDGVGIYGGFSTGGSIWEDRDPNQYETILSGDLNGDDGADFANNGENSYNVCHISWTSGITILDGFTVTGGNANTIGNYVLTASGGAINNEGGCLLLFNCKFTQNYALYGGAIAMNTPLTTGTIEGKISNCLFYKNLTERFNVSGYNYGGKGSALYLRGYSPQIEKCDFISNEGALGGVLFCFSFAGWPENEIYTNPTVIGCRFCGNKAWRGGAIELRGECHITLINSSFIGNIATLSGGGVMYSDPFFVTSYPHFINCSFVSNTAAQGGGVVSCRLNQDLQIENSILWDNGGSHIDFSQGNLSVLSSCIQDDNPDDASIPFGGAANNNIDDNPVFVHDPYDGGDGWGVGDNDDYGDLHLSYTSPCIDAADNTAVPADSEDIDQDLNTTEPMPWDLDGNPRFYDDAETVDTGIGTPPIVDMGAYEGANTDGDGIPDHIDNCPDIYNPDQSDGDEDQIGDVCDNCPNSYDPNQVDTDIDGVGDVCDNCPDDINPNQEDGDGDLVGNVCDNCPDDPNPNQEDTDVDSIGNVCDNCPDEGNADQTDSDGDGIGDECECSAANLDGLNPVNFEDYAILAQGWGDIYGITQLAQLAQHWLEECP